MTFCTFGKESPYLISWAIQGRILFEPIFLQGTNLDRTSFRPTEDLKEVQSSSTDLEVEFTKKSSLTLSM